MNLSAKQMCSWLASLCLPSFPQLFLVLRVCEPILVTLSNFNVNDRLKQILNSLFWTDLLCPWSILISPPFHLNCSWSLPPFKTPNIALANIQLYIVYSITQHSAPRKRFLDETMVSGTILNLWVAFLGWIIDIS